MVLFCVYASKDNGVKKNKMKMFKKSLKLWNEKMFWMLLKKKLKLQGRIIQNNILRVFVLIQNWINTTIPEEQIDPYKDIIQRLNVN